MNAKTFYQVLRSGQYVRFTAVRGSQHRNNTAQLRAVMVCARSYHSNVTGPDSTNSCIPSHLSRHFINAPPTENVWARRLHEAQQMNGVVVYVRALPTSPSPDNAIARRCAPLSPHCVDNIAFPWLTKDDRTPNIFAPSRHYDTDDRASTKSDWLSTGIAAFNNDRSYDYTPESCSWRSGRSSSDLFTDTFPHDGGVIDVATPKHIRPTTDETNARYLPSNVIEQRYAAIGGMSTLTTMPISPLPSDPIWSPHAPLFCHSALWY